MRRFIPLAVLFLLFLALTFSPRTLALYDHPTVQESAQADFVEKVYLVHTPSELGRCTTKDYHVTVATVATDWVSPREGIVVIGKGEGRWHRAQAWRRSF